MRKFAAICMCLLFVAGCAEHDPILPGERTPVFGNSDINMLNTTVTNLPDTYVADSAVDCPYRQDASNVIWDGQRKVFSGFPTNNSVQSNQQPICAHGYVYAGLTTGEVVKVAPNSRKIMWIADVFRRSNMTGGAAIVDIVAPLVMHDGALYVGGLGDAFCRINPISGDKKWCVNIGVAVPFIVIGARPWTPRLPQHMTTKLLPLGNSKFRPKTAKLSMIKYYSWVPMAARPRTTQS